MLSARRRAADRLARFWLDLLRQATAADGRGWTPELQANPDVRAYNRARAAAVAGTPAEEVLAGVVEGVLGEELGG